MLHEEFTDSQRAACYIASGLSREFPDVMVKVTLFPGGEAHLREMVVDTGHLEPVLERFCKRLPGSTVHVDYDPDYRNGLVGILRCNCNRVGKASCSLHCKCEEDRPHAVVCFQKQEAAARA